MQAIAKLELNLWWLIFVKPLLKEPFFLDFLCLITGSTVNPYLLLWETLHFLRITSRKWVVFTFIVALSALLFFLIYSLKENEGSFSPYLDSSAFNLSYKFLPISSSCSLGRHCYNIYFLTVSFMAYTFYYLY